jgi:hypothetical protein
MYRKEIGNITFLTQLKIAAFYFSREIESINDEAMGGIHRQYGQQTDR